MSIEAPSVPFTTETYEGFATTEGLLSREENTLILEFKTKDSFVGLIQSEVKRVEIPLAILTGFEFKSKLLSNKILIRSNSLQTLDSIPGSKQGMVTLKIRRTDKETAAALASNISLYISESRLKRLDEELNKLEE
ncbi:MAG: hypothetical protein AB8G77_05550 [Rhodothermales bacterium]